MLNFFKKILDSNVLFNEIVLKKNTHLFQNTWKTVYFRNIFTPKYFYIHRRLSFIIYRHLVAVSEHFFNTFSLNKRNFGLLFESLSDFSSPGRCYIEVQCLRNVINLRCLKMIFINLFLLHCIIYKSISFTELHCSSNRLSDCNILSSKNSAWACYLIN